VNRKPEDSDKEGESIPDSLKGALEAGIKTAVKTTRKQGWKRYIPLFLMCIVINFYPQILHANWVGYLHFLLTTFFLIVLKGVFIIFPVIYFRESARPTNGEPRRRLPPDLAVIFRGIESYLVPTIAFMITAWWSPENVSYGSAVTLISGALTLGLAEGLIDLKSQEQASGL
jgi:hypothetical protein